MKRFLAQNVAFAFPKRWIYLEGSTVKSVIEIESSVTDGTENGLQQYLQERERHRNASMKAVEEL